MIKPIGIESFAEGLQVGFALAQAHAKLALEYDRGFTNTAIDWTAANEALAIKLEALKPPAPMQTFADFERECTARRETLSAKRTAYAVLTASDGRIIGVGVFGEPHPTVRIGPDCTSVVLFERTGANYAEAQQAVFEELKHARWAWTGILTSDGIGRYYRDARGFVLTRMPDPHAEFKATGDEERALATGAEELMRMVYKRLEAYKQDPKNANVKPHELEHRAIVATILCELEAYVTK